MIQILKINAVKFDESIYSTIIKSFCKYNDIINVEKYLAEMKNNNIKLKQRTYTHLIQMYYNHNNVNKLKQLYNDVKIYKININENDYLLILIKFFKNNITIYFNEILNYLEHNNLLLTMSLFPLLNDTFKLNPTTISEKGYCMKSNALLKLQDISYNDKIRMMVKLDINISNKKLKQFHKFKTWMYNSPKYDVVIDGANIGYYNHRPDKNNDKICFLHINNTLKSLSNKKYNVLIILHERHFKNITKNELNIVKNWKNNNNIYISSSGINDDIYWLYISMYHSAYIVTNDNLKDHQFNSNKINIWKNKYIINYDISNNNEFIFHFPKIYSKCIQKINDLLYLPFINDNEVKWYYTKVCFKNVLIK